MFRLAILLGAGNAALAIICGAFAAHVIQSTLNDRMLAAFNTAVDYHLYHALALIVIGLLLKQFPTSNLLKIAVYLTTFGILLFCGSLYALSLTGYTKLGMITPFGGVAFIIAWVFVLVAFIGQSSNS